MNVLVDTPVWSLALRRKAVGLSTLDKGLSQALTDLIRDGRAQLLGIVRQELLSGIREEEKFTKLRDYLRAFDEPHLEVQDYEEAAAMHNRCRSHGVTGSAVDFLISAVAHRRGWQVFTTDHDFERYANVLGLRLYRIA